MILFNSKIPTDWVFVAVMVTLMMLLQLKGPELFRYQQNWMDNGEYWRILSAHWVHVNWKHFFLNVAGLLLCLSIARPGWSSTRWLLYQFYFALGISFLFTLLNPQLDWYVGYSGILYGIFLLAAIDLFRRDRLIALLLGVAIVTKIMLEQTSELNLTTSDMIGSPVIVDAHLYGVILAILIAIMNRLIKIAGYKINNTRLNF
ncbi:MAG: rhombosortase [Gammaproteobacteria bacterium]|nr:rhombosortase [Gammaproteobacteria bacterium]